MYSFELNDSVAVYIAGKIVEAMGKKPFVIVQNNAFEEGHTTPLDKAIREKLERELQPCGFIIQAQTAQCNIMFYDSIGSIFFSRRKDVIDIYRSGVIGIRRTGTQPGSTYLKQMLLIPLTPRGS